MKKKLGILMVVSSFALFGVAGCGGGDDDESSPTESSVTTTSPETGPTGNGQPTNGEGGTENTAAAPVGTISDPDDPAVVRRAAREFSAGTAQIFNERDPQTFCAMVDPQFIEKQFENGLEGCEEQMGQVFGPDSRTLELTPGKLVVRGNRATVQMRGPDGQPAGIAIYVQRGDRWFLAMDGGLSPAEQPSG